MDTTRPISFNERSVTENSIAIIGGFILGNVANMGLITISEELIPSPSGADVSTMQKPAQAMQQFEPKHCLFPLLAHVFGKDWGSFKIAHMSTADNIGVEMFEYKNNQTIQDFEY
ncbi:MAG: hypothetical protein ACJAU4_001695 [Glaciecola sp.]